VESDFRLVVQYVNWDQIAGYLQATPVHPGEVGVRNPKEKASGARKRTDGRRQLLIYLSPEVIVELKRAALSHERPAYELAEEAIRVWLSKDKRKR
jgi:hypothetical protein